MSEYHIQSRDPLIGPYAGVKLVRSAFVIGLREMFKTDDKYLYVEDERGMTNTEQSLIEIVDTHPLEIQKFPAITIPSCYERENTFFFGDDIIYPVYVDGKETAILRGSPLHLTTEIQIRAYSSIERDEMTDRAYNYLRTVRTKLAMLGIEARHITMNAPSEEELGARMQFIGNISANTYSEWTFEDPNLDTDLLISGFKIAVSLH